MTISAAVDLLTTTQASEVAGVKSTGVHRLLARAGVRPVGREPGRNGQNLYDAAQVEAAVQARPGRWPSASVAAGRIVSSVEETSAGDGALDAAIAAYEVDAGRITDEVIAAARAPTDWQPASPLTK